MPDFTIKERIKRMTMALSGSALLIATLGALIQLFIHRKDMKTGVKLLMDKLLYGAVVVAVIWIIYFIIQWFMKSGTDYPGKDDSGSEEVH